MDVERFIAGFNPDRWEPLFYSWLDDDGRRNFIYVEIELRGPIVKAVLADRMGAPLDLIRCLWDADTWVSMSGYGIFENSHEVAQLLLDRGGPDVAMDYLRGRMRSFDAMCTGGRIRLGPEMAELFVARCRKELESASTDRERAIAKLGVERFGVWLVGGDCELR